MYFKYLERLILQRIKAVLEERTIVEQAGFRSGRSTCYQVLALSAFIENGFQLKQKTGAVFLDLTAAYDTVSRLILYLDCHQDVQYGRRSGQKKFSTPSHWLDEWLFADAVNGSLVADPSIQVPGFDLPRRLWCTLNR